MATVTSKANEQVDGALEAVINNLVNDDPYTYITRKGVHLTLHPISSQIIVAATEHVKAPSVPKVWIEDKQREEYNDQDPAYREEVERINMLRGEVTQAVYMTMGTTVAKLPEGMYGPDATEWSDDIEALGYPIEIPATGKRRYFKWLTLYALVDGDIQPLIQRIGIASGGATEAAVREAVRSFRAEQERDANRGVPDEATPEHGDSPTDQ